MARRVVIFICIPLACFIFWGYFVQVKNSKMFVWLYYFPIPLPSYKQLKGKKKINNKNTNKQEQVGPSACNSSKPPLTAQTVQKHDLEAMVIKRKIAWLPSSQWHLDYFLAEGDLGRERGNAKRGGGEGAWYVTLPYWKEATWNGADAGRHRHAIRYVSAKDLQTPTAIFQDHSVLG